MFGAFTQRSWAADTLIGEIFLSNSAKVLPLLACAAFILFERSRRGQDLSFLAKMLLGSFLAMLISRLMQNFSAHRPRPLHNPELNYELPHGIDTARLEGWSSFPSDTSALAFALAAGVLIASVRLGVVAMIWAVVIVAFPRAYAGFHYPSDLIGGALIGLFCTLGAAPLILRATVGRMKMKLDAMWQPLIFTLLFLYAFQLGSMFDDVRTLGSYAKAVLGR